MFKLTLVSVFFRGQRVSCFMYVKDGKPTQIEINALLERISHSYRGQTYSLGA